jgi:uncharacterized protein YijF (DUF1287 family)
MNRHQTGTGRAANRPRGRRWMRAVLILLLAAAAVFGGWRLYQTMRAGHYYTAQELGIETVTSPLDADGDGIDDYTDLLLGGRAYINTRPRYKSAYYAGGYPDDGCGVCTDVIWQAFQAAGYSLRDLVDADIAASPEAYPNITDRDANIDFRRVENLLTFFTRHARSLPTDFDDPAAWQPGDIVVFTGHIGLCSDRRNAKGIPFLIHHGNLIDGAVEWNQMAQYTVAGHFRWTGTT